MELVNDPVEPSYEQEALIIEAMIKYARLGNDVTLLGSGNSMYPLMRNGCDYAVLSDITDKALLKRGDIILYFTNGHFVLHRIHHIDSSGFYMLGDGNITIEPPLPSDYIFLKAHTIRRGEKIINLNSRFMKLYGSVWLFIRPIRPFFFKVFSILTKIKHFLRKEQKK